MEPAANINLISALLPLAVIVFIIAVGVIMLNRHFRKNLYRQVLENEEMEKQYSYDLLKSSIEVQEVERKRIAHDLHDEIGALLTTSRIYFNQMSSGQSALEPAQLNEKINFLFDEMITNVRRISHDLRPVVLENFGLVQAIESVADKLTDSGIGCFIDDDIPFKITPKAELILYRMMQELIGNALKHSQAKNITIKLNTKDNRFVLDFSDDGIGFKRGTVKYGLGIMSIESRLKLLGGRMIVVSEPGEGTQFIMDMDIQRLTKDE